MISTDVSVLVDAAAAFVADPDFADEAGRCARAHALRRYGLDRFLTDWDHLIAEVTQ